MKKTNQKLPIIIFLCLVAVTLCKKRDAPNAHIEKGVLEAERLARILESPDRQAWQMPDRVVQELHLKNGDTVADIGAGTGYFARRFAERVRPSGISIAYDIDPAMVEFVSRDAKERGLEANYKAHLIASRSPMLESNYYDLIFLCNTYQYLENRGQYLKLLAASLKVNGRIAVIDFVKLDKADEESGEVPENLVDKKTVVREFKKAGFKLKRDIKFLPSQFFLEFRRK